MWWLVHTPWGTDLVEVSYLVHLPPLLPPKLGSHVLQGLVKSGDEALCFSISLLFSEMHSVHQFFFLKKKIHFFCESLECHHQVISVSYWIIEAVGCKDHKIVPEWELLLLSPLGSQHLQAPALAQLLRLRRPGVPGRALRLRPGHWWLQLRHRRRRVSMGVALWAGLSALRCTGHFRFCMPSWAPGGGTGTAVGVLCKW